jgi:hypothetical protein
MNNQNKPDILKQAENYLESKHISKNHVIYRNVDDYEFTSELLSDFAQHHHEQEMKEVVKVIQSALKIKDLWLIKEENCPPEHRGEMEALSRMEYSLISILSDLTKTEEG